jgi:hypothetical protein
MRHGMKPDAAVGVERLIGQSEGASKLRYLGLTFLKQAVAISEATARDRHVYCLLG